MRLHADGGKDLARTLARPTDDKPAIDRLTSGESRHSCEDSGQAVRTHNSTAEQSIVDNLRRKGFLQVIALRPRFGVFF